MSSTFERVKSLVVERLGIDDWRVTPDARLWADLEMDDLELAGFRIALEREFAREIREEEFMQAQTLSDIIFLLEK